MRLNPGIQKYRDGAKSATKAKATSDDAAIVTVSKKAPAKAGRGANSEKAEELEQAAAEAAAAADAAKEEEDLQKEIAAELASESAQTDQLVKPDVSPVNSTRD